MKNSKDSTIKVEVCNGKISINGREWSIEDTTKASCNCEDTEDVKMKFLIPLIVSNLGKKYKSTSYYLDILFININEDGSMSKETYLRLLASLASINPASTLSYITKVIANDLDCYYESTGSKYLSIKPKYALNVHTREVIKLSEEELKIIDPKCITLFRSEEDAEAALGLFGELLVLHE